MVKPIEPLESRMERLVDRNGGPDACWLWTGSTDAYGYGAISFGRSKKLKSHRVAWEIENGPIPVGQSILHRCDTPPCCNPAHLFVGSQGDNMRDAAAKGRQFVPEPSRRTGESNPSARLSNADRAEIQKLAGTLTQYELAERFGVSQPTISRVLSAIASSSTSTSSSPRGSV
jgi:HNH endonuclease